MKVGYTSGVFDMFHVGHLRILKRAKALCDFLIVAVSTDELVLSYKGKTPIIPLADRMEVLSGIKYVDNVVVQKTRDKCQALDELGFDIMFVGDDWKGSPLFEEVERKFAARGVEVVYFPYTRHVSSSRLAVVLQSIDDRGRGIYPNVA